MITTKRVVTPKELEDAFFVRQKVFVDEQDVPVHLEMDEHDQSAVHFVAYDDEMPIGAGRIREPEPGVAKVERVCILPQYRGKHLGNLMMETMESYAKEANLTTVKLNAQSYAVPFYEKLLYQITSPEFMDAGIPHRAMQKKL
ncbi:GNAT family N-acetyltransferase [Paenisporosarcina quisquiliarum]|uniref:GNAT family N-acetyltransferase n=1 Tax=Paenisporosarcina quisquiliarum TaxID=365346 RepID=A0A9X3LEG3_9BACL|nr:GNAT family N-acetyltransferase [Paenisporosarcina quisquiliarum]MCZ8536543.1 GNAT family N-acetyltransferase [Paenisporosarcina quisquiliarum]